jgi:hypothetical protein
MGKVEKVIGCFQEIHNPNENNANAEITSKNVIKCT